MGEFDYKVQRQRLLLEAEEWAKGVHTLHAHSLTSMWYETEASKADIEENGPVIDTMYNDGRIIRQRNGKTILILGEQLTGDKLVDKYLTMNA